MSGAVAILAPGARRKAIRETCEDLNEPHETIGGYPCASVYLHRHLDYGGLAPQQEDQEQKEKINKGKRHE
jgi:hypothetical protein